MGEASPRSPAPERTSPCLFPRNRALVSSVAKPFRLSSSIPAGRNGGRTTAPCAGSRSVPCWSGDNGLPSGIGPRSPMSAAARARGHDRRPPTGRALRCKRSTRPIVRRVLCLGDRLFVHSRADEVVDQLSQVSFGTGAQPGELAAEQGSTLVAMADLPAGSNGEEVGV